MGQTVVHLDRAAAATAPEGSPQLERDERALYDLMERRPNRTHLFGDFRSTLGWSIPRADEVVHVLMRHGLVERVSTNGYRIIPERQRKPQPPPEPPAPPAAEEPAPEPLTGERRDEVSELVLLAVGEVPPWSRAAAIAEKCGYDIKTVSTSLSYLFRTGRLTRRGDARRYEYALPGAAAPPLLEEPDADAERLATEAAELAEVDALVEKALALAEAERRAAVREKAITALVARGIARDKAEVYVDRAAGATS